MTEKPYSVWPKLLYNVKTPQRLCPLKMILFLCKLCTKQLSDKNQLNSHTHPFHIPYVVSDCLFYMYLCITTRFLFIDLACSANTSFNNFTNPRVCCVCADLPVGAEWRRWVWPCSVLRRCWHYDRFSIATFTVYRPPSQQRSSSDLVVISGVVCSEGVAMKMFCDTSENFALLLTV